MTKPEIYQQLRCLLEEIELLVSDMWAAKSDPSITRDHYEQMEARLQVMWQQFNWYLRLLGQGEKYTFLIAVGLMQRSR